jgi:PIN domain nuclease of toxin-antitoxin system
MKYGLDTHTFLWAAVEPRKLSSKAVAALEEPDADVLLSAASLWEIGILQSLKRIQLKLSIAEIAEMAASRLRSELTAIEPEHIDRMRRLPFHHRDPFDRLLIGQALHLKASVIGKDPWFDADGLDRVW